MNIWNAVKTWVIGYPAELPKPTRPAPPMPECKQPQLEVPEKDISEPVIKLLEMLDRDEWEPSRVTRRCEYECEVVKFSVTNIYKEGFIIEVTATSNLYSSRWLYTVENKEWMTRDEHIAVAEKSMARSGEIAKLNRETRAFRERELYKQYLDSV